MRPAARFSQMASRCRRAERMLPHRTGQARESAWPEGRNWTGKPDSQGAAAHESSGAAEHRPCQLTDPEILRQSRPHLPNETASDLQFVVKCLGQFTFHGRFAFAEETCLRSASRRSARAGCVQSQNGPQAGRTLHGGIASSAKRRNSPFTESANPRSGLCRKFRR